MMSSAFRASYHTHNEYCDGSGTVREVVEAALDAGLEEVGISSHAPLPFATDWAMPLDRLDRYLEDVRAVQREYAGRIRVLRGLEVDVIPDADVADFQRRVLFPLDLDHVVGSVHYLGRHNQRTIDHTDEQFRAILDEEYGGDVEAMVTDYYRRVKEGVRLPQVRIVGHLDRVKMWNGGETYWRQGAAWYRRAVDGALRAIAATGIVVELNTAGWRHGLDEPYPSPWVLARCRELGVPVTISSDSHRPEDVIRDFDRASACLQELGIEPQTLTLRP